MPITIIITTYNKFNIFKEKLEQAIAWRCRVGYTATPLPHMKNIDLSFGIQNSLSYRMILLEQLWYEETTWNVNIPILYTWPLSFPFHRLKR